MIRDTAVRQQKAESFTVRRKPVEVEALSHFDPAKHEVLGEEAFLRSLYLERKRSERSQRPFLLALLRNPIGLSDPSGQVDTIVSALTTAKRETDTIGWYETGHALGAKAAGCLQRNNPAAPIETRLDNGHVPPVHS